MDHELPGSCWHGTKLDQTGSVWSELRGASHGEWLHDESWRWRDYTESFQFSWIQWIYTETKRTGLDLGKECYDRRVGMVGERQVEHLSD
jgi:hypothetical protein